MSSIWILTVKYPYNESCTANASLINIQELPGHTISLPKAHCSKMYHFNKGKHLCAKFFKSWLPNAFIN